MSTSLIYGELKVAWYDLELYACIEICFYLTRLTRVSCYCFDFSYLSVQSFSKSTCKETKLKIVQCDWPSVWECQPSELWSQRLQYISTRVSISTSNFKPRLFNHELFNPIHGSRFLKSLGLKGRGWSLGLESLGLRCPSTIFFMDTGTFYIYAPWSWNIGICNGGFYFENLFKQFFFVLKRFVHVNVPIKFRNTFYC